MSITCKHGNEPVREHDIAILTRTGVNLDCFRCDPEDHPTAAAFEHSLATDHDTFAIEGEWHCLDCNGCGSTCCGQTPTEVGTPNIEVAPEPLYTGVY